MEKIRESCRQLQEFIDKNTEEAEYDLSYHKGRECISVSIIDEETGGCFNIATDNERSTRAFYKLSEEEELKSVVVDITQCLPHMCTIKLKPTGYTVTIGI